MGKLCHRWRHTLAHGRPPRSLRSLPPEGAFSALRAAGRALMKARSFDPHRLDVEAFARDGTPLAGRWPLDALPRLREVQMPGSDVPHAVDWSARGELQQPR